MTNDLPVCSSDVLKTHNASVRPVKKRVVYLTNEQRRKIKRANPKVPHTLKGGRPRTDDGLALEGILRILKTGARWKDIPDKYPHPSTRWCSLNKWYEAKVLKDLWRAFLSELAARGTLDCEERFIDANILPARKRHQR